MGLKLANSVVFIIIIFASIGGNILCQVPDSNDSVDYRDYSVCWHIPCATDDDCGQYECSYCRNSACVPFPPYPQGPLKKSDGVST
ncbi:hypothetical protein OROMI_006444 [Orobanche minor]